MAGRSSTLRIVRDAARRAVGARRPSRRHERAARSPRAPRSSASRLLLLQRAPAAADEALALAESIVARASAVPPTPGRRVASALYSRLVVRHRRPRRRGPLRLREAAQRALALDPSQPVALRTLAIVAGRGDHAFDAAEALFKRALDRGAVATRRRDSTTPSSSRSRAGTTLPRVQLNLARLHDPLSPSVHLAVRGLSRLRAATRRCACRVVALPRVRRVQRLGRSSAKA